MSKRQRDLGAITKKKAKNRFKKLVRNVILNMQWLNEANEDAGTSLNVKKISVRQKRKTGMMTMAEKSLLRTPHHTRTVEERKKLCNIVANLSCFSKFPPKVRARLVPHVKFINVSPGRTILKKGDHPVTIYFITAGEVEMSRNIYNKATKLRESHSEAIFGPGDCIGDIDVLEDSRRTHTYVATSHCELLVVNQNTYELVLQQSMQKLWQEKKAAVRALDYFEFFNEKQMVNACKYANIQQFNTLETIYTEDEGSMSPVYFVLSGECVILQCLHMKVSMDKREKVYQLAKVSRMLSVDEILKKNDPQFDPQDYVMSTSSDEEKKTIMRGLRKMGLKEIQKRCAEMMNATNRKSIKSSGVQQKTRRRTRDSASKPEWHQKKLDLYERYITGGDEDETGEEEENVDHYKTPESSHSLLIRPTSENTEMHVEMETEGTEVFTANNELRQPSYHSRDSDEDAESVNYETHFIDVGSLSYGGIFGLGEKSVHRVIMARTTVQCIMIPRFWLMEAAQNPGNLWQRKRFYIECNLPTREALYKNFLKTRKWEKFRQDYIQSIVGTQAHMQHTKVEDIPIISRIVETGGDEA